MIEAVPADAETIKVRGFGLKTVGALAQYYKGITPIVHNARMPAREKKVVTQSSLFCRPSQSQHGPSK